MLYADIATKLDLTELEARIAKLEDYLSSVKRETDGLLASPVPTPTSGPSEGSN